MYLDIIEVEDKVEHHQEDGRVAEDQDFQDVALGFLKEKSLKKSFDLKRETCRDLGAAPWR